MKRHLDFFYGATVPPSAVEFKFYSYGMYAARRYYPNGSNRMHFCKRGARKPFPGYKVTASFLGNKFPESGAAVCAKTSVGFARSLAEKFSSRFAPRFLRATLIVSHPETDVQSPCLRGDISLGCPIRDSLLALFETGANKFTVCSYAGIRGMEMVIFFSRRTSVDERFSNIV